MSISNYGELLSLCNDYVNRTDLVDKLPSFINFAEKRIFRRLRCPSNERVAQIITNLPYLVIPNDALEVRSLSVDGEVMQTVPYEEILRRVQHNPQPTTPKTYGRLRERLYLWPVPDSEQQYTYLLNYWNDQSGLTADEDTSDILQILPEVYVYGCMVEVNTYQKEMKEAAAWDAKLTEAITEANSHSRESDLLGKPIAVLGGYHDG